VGSSHTQFSQRVFAAEENRPRQCGAGDGLVKWFVMPEPQDWVRSPTVGACNAPSDAWSITANPAHGHGLKRPNPALPWFGFHEVVHTFTVAFICHYIAASIATYALR